MTICAWSLEGSDAFGDVETDGEVDLLLQAMCRAMFLVSSVYETRLKSPILVSAN